jgi:protein-S-isoprenylcysteine O-methyltransferase Ste14
MAVAALVGYSLLLLGAFGVRTLLHLHRTGTSGWRAPATTAARVGDALFTAGIAALLVALVLDLLDAVQPLAAFDRVAVEAGGAVLLLAGAAIALVAQAQMGAAWRAGVEVPGHHQLVRRGLFSTVRNPFYLGMLTASAGVVLLAPSVVTMAGWLAVFVGCEIDVRLVEEPRLRDAHGDRFVSYTRAVPRFLPRPRH